MVKPDPFDPDALRLDGVNFDAARIATSKKPPRHRPGEKFLRGPIPWTWLQQAARLRGSALGRVDNGVASCVAGVIAAGA